MIKGVVLAGGTGSRLFPLTQSTSKQLLPIYDKPMIYYSLSVLMLAGIQDIAIITTPDDKDSFQRLLGDGSQLGINLHYFQQSEPNGIAEAFLITESFIQGHNVCLVLGDNIFYGSGFSPKLLKAGTLNKGATIFGYQVKDPERFGVVEINENSQAVSIEEKPSQPKSNYAVTGLYFYDQNVVEIAKSIEPSARGELEISCVNEKYLEQGLLNVEILGRGFAWLDTGTHDSLMEAGQFVQTVEHRQGFKIACLEEISYINGWLNKSEMVARGESLAKTGYGQYILSLVE